MRVCIILAYNGSKTQGSQEQNSHENTIINKIITALRAIGVFQKPVGSGRTDKGVHALNQVLHLDLPSFWTDLVEFKKRLNFYLKPYIYIKSIKRANADFHARFSAKARAYRYVLNHNEFDVFMSDFCYFYPRVDTSRLNFALNLFVGMHNFMYFKKTGSQTKDDIRIIYKCYAYRYKNLTIIYIKANGFLRSQVRMMVNAALACEKDKISFSNLQEQLECKKQHLKTLAPFSGLYLTRVFY